MWKRLALVAVLASGLLAANAMAQFSGPSVAGRSSTAVEARDARLGSYLTLEGNIVNHLRGDYYTFRDASGEIRVEISSSVWNGRQVGPTDKVRLLGEVDSGSSGRYVWVKTLDVLR
jgi:uncharacterized protein (TIGR00156 family)